MRASGWSGSRGWLVRATRLGKSDGLFRKPAEVAGEKRTFVHVQMAGRICKEVRGLINYAGGNADARKGRRQVRLNGEAVGAWAITQRKVAGALGPAGVGAYFVEASVSLIRRATAISRRSLVSSV